MAYPDDIDDFTVNTDGVDTVSAADINALQDAIVEIETVLGLNPEGSETDLVTRLNKISGAVGLNFTESTVLTIAGGSITPTQNWHHVDTEAGAATDNLDTITAGADGQVLFMRAVNPVRVITIRNEVGNITCNGQQNIILAYPSDLAILIYDDNEGAWLCAGFVSLAAANTWTGVQTFGAAENHKYTALNADTTLDLTHNIVGMDASGGARTITLPTAVGCAGRPYTIIKTDSSANVVAVEAAGAETIAGSDLGVAGQYDSATVVSDGANWQLIGWVVVP